MDKTNTAPLISVIMAVYNCEKYVGDAVDSILSQTFDDFEFIIINDGSKDRTEEIIKLRRDQRIIYIANKENLGQTKSLNMGIVLARGKYIARMDADDFSLPDRFSVQVEFMQRNPKVALTGSWARLVNDRNRPVRTLRYPRTPNLIRLILARLLNRPCLAHPSVMIKKEIFSQVGLYNESYFVCQDYDLWLRIARGYQIRNIPKALFNYRDNKESSSRINSYKTKEEISGIIFSGIKFYLPDLSPADQDSLLCLLMFNRQKERNAGSRAFETLDNFFKAIRGRDGERLGISFREYDYLRDLAEFFYLPQLFLCDIKYAGKAFRRLYRKYGRWLYSCVFLKSAGRALC